MKKVPVFNAMTLVALLMLFFACNSGTPGVQKPDVPKNPKEKQEPKKPEAKDPETKKPETPDTPTPPQEDPKKPEPKQPETPTPDQPKKPEPKQPETPPTPAPPKDEPKKPEPKQPETPPTPAPPKPEPKQPEPKQPETPPTPAPPTPAPTPVPPTPVPPSPAPTPVPPTPVPPTPPTPKPPKEKVLTIVGKWKQTESADNYDKNTWKTSQANLEISYEFKKGGKYTQVIVFGTTPTSATGSYTFGDRKLTIKVESGPSLGALGTLEIKHIVWNDETGTAVEIWLKEVNGTKGYKLRRQ